MVICEGGMPKNKPQTKRQPIKPSISAGNENKEWLCDVIKYGLNYIK